MKENHFEFDFEVCSARISSFAFVWIPRMAWNDLPVGQAYSIQIQSFSVIRTSLVIGISVRNVLLLVPTYFLSEKKYLFELVRKLEVISFQNYDNFHLRATSYPKLINLSLLTLQNSFTLRIILNPRGKWWWPAVMMTLLALQDIKLIRLKPRGMISHRVCD